MLGLKKESSKPMHIALTLDGSKAWSDRNKKELEEAFKQKFEHLFNFIPIQVEKEIPIMTFYVLTKSQDYVQSYLDELRDFLLRLKATDYLHRNQIKVSVVGKWYNLPSELVDAIKELIEETKDYDTYFLNFCIKYNGQEEIVDALKIMARQVQAGKIEVDLITEEMIKDNLYTSYFLPPNVIIKTGVAKNTSLLLWDSVYARIYYARKPWQDFTKKDLIKAIE